MWKPVWIPTRPSQCCQILLVLGMVARTQGQIPRSCATDWHISNRTCCPRWWGDGSPCGSASKRGYCQELALSSPWPAGQVGEGGAMDFRLAWPSYFFSRLCVCQQRYGGVDCGECAHGWVGSQCQQQHLVQRQDLWQMSVPERDLFLDRLLLAKQTVSSRYVIYASSSRQPASPFRFQDASLYNVFAWAHYLCAKPRGDGQPGIYAHRGPAFPSWHRLYLLSFEREMRNLTGDRDFYLPYWTWAGQQSCDVCTDNLFGSNDAQGFLNPNSRFRNWLTFCSGEGVHELDFGLVCPPGATLRIRRHPDVNRGLGGLPSRQDVKLSLQLHSYDSTPYNERALSSFRNTLEGYLLPGDPSILYPSMHNMVHFVCGGTMSSLTYSSNDPLFLTHHAFIDKIFEMWLRAHPENAHVYPTDPLVPPGHRADDAMPPFIPVARNQDFMRSSLEFGYTYSNMTI
ncbi:tyrosinase-like [Scyliorhinus canicula]|uniref:tyrosinase-like n=1 Tax=Scyliorhinus canicula TaxID=7830 RepID=UPI0018F4BC32|nr:tyrosinase-like [Scyliorhinus canicula]